MNINDAINTIKETCKKYKVCIECPMNCNCNEYPAEWKECVDNAPAVEITEDDIKQAIKTGFDDGYGMAKAKFSPKQGEWKPKTDFDGFTYCVCSNCNWLNCGEELNFCPNCGADMRGEDNGK